MANLDNVGNTKLSKADSWTAIRVSCDTKCQLESIRDIWAELPAGMMANELGSDTVRSGQVSKRDAIGLDQVIRRLILLWRKHTERSVKSAEKRKKAKASKVAKATELKYDETILATADGFNLGSKPVTIDLHLTGQGQGDDLAKGQGQGDDQGQGQGQGDDQGQGQGQGDDQGQGQGQGDRE